MKNFILNIFYLLGINRLFYFFNRNRQLILTFHNIIPDDLYDNSLHLLVSYKESLFRKQLQLIKKFFEVTTSIGEPGTCVITFDDGYQNNYSVAHKILKQEGLKAIFFIPVKNEFLWIDKILMWLSYTPDGEYLIFDERVKLFSYSHRENLLKKIWDLLLKNYNYNFILKELDKIYNFSMLNFDKKLFDYRFTPLKDSHIKEMKDYGHIIACHSFKHDILSALPNLELNNEIKECEKEINNLYNSNFFSYPFGSELEVSESVIKTLEGSKFEYAFMNMFSPGFEYGRFAIPRMMLLPDEFNNYQIASRLSGLRYFLKYRKLFPLIKVN